MSNSVIVVDLKAHVAGNISPTCFSGFGNRLIGNMIPDNIREGMNTSCATIVSLDIFWITKPRMQPMPNDEVINTASDTK